MTEVIEYMITEEQFKVRTEMYRRRFPNVSKIYVTDVYLDYKEDMVPVHIGKEFCKSVVLEELFYKRATPGKRRKLYVKRTEYDKFEKQLIAQRRGNAS
jgi:hypothetical protein